VREIERQILKAVSDLAGIEVLALFGSRASGSPRPDSDLDIAVLTASSDATERRRLLSAIAVALADLAPEGRVDVVFLDEAPDFLRQRIMEKGTVLLCRDPDLWMQWRIRTMREYGDREHVLRLFEEAQRRRLTTGGKSGRSARALESLERARGLPD
jgi:predicted nucleotidyltransferase